MRGYADVFRFGNFWREVPEIAEAGSSGHPLSRCSQSSSLATIYHRQELLLQSGADHLPCVPLPAVKVPEERRALLELKAAGLSSREIGQRLGISERTVQRVLEDLRRRVATEG